ncbi:Post-GPI attachment to proteins factor 3 [Picochlorum sp. SENEW3]|nr:Post-GPI attachment to proteins factor 3 [Picochlorum sp. SENEW3]
MTLLPALGRASQGDQSAIYQSCLVGCRRGGLPNGGVEDVARGVSESPFCARGDDSGHRLSRLDEFILRRIMRWDDQDKTVYKYHGKWPFVRILGMQEPASVVLSLLNLGANVNCILLLRKYVWSMEPATGVERMGFSHRFLWYGHFILASNAWIWSAVFHSRDTAMTERLDYFSAGAVMILMHTLVLAEPFLTCFRLLRQVGCYLPLV